MKKTLDLKAVPAKLLTFVKKLRRYVVVVFVVVLIGIYSFLVFRINGLTRSEPSDEAVQEKLQTVIRPKIDQSSVDKIQQLQDNSVEVQSLFQQARDNPFQE